MSGWIKYWYRRTKLGESKFHDVTDYVQRLNNETLVAFAATLDNQRLEFDVNLVQPFDEDLVRIYPECGDDIVITDEDITEVYQELCGWIYNIVPVDPNYLSDSIAVWHCKLKHRDFSNEWVTIDQSTIISDTDLFDLILNNNVKDFLGGTLPSGKVIPKYTQEYNSIDYPSYKFAGKSLENISQATKILGLHYKLIHFVEPHTTNNIVVYQSIRIFDKAGDGTITSDWEVGINNEILQGDIPNIKFISTTLTPDEPETIKTETRFQPEIDAMPVVNVIRLNGFITDGIGTVTFETFVQDDQRSEFTLSKPGMDILYCARMVDCKILSISTPNLVFTIDLESSEKIYYDELRLNTTVLDTRLVMRIKSGGIYYIRKYTIIGQTVTLDAVGGTEIAIPALVITDQCLHVNGYDVLKEGLNSYPGDDQGFVKKSMKTFGDRCSVIFTDYDKPNQEDVVIIGYLALSEFRLPHAYLDSKRIYDMAVVTEQIPFPITQAQFDTIAAEYEKLTVPRITFTLNSKRENVCQVGWKIPINLIYEYKVNGDFLVDTVNGVVVCTDGIYNGKPTVIQDIKLCSYRDDLADFLARFKNQYALTEALLEENTVQILNSNIIVSAQLLTDFIIPLASVPTGLTTDTITSTSVEFLWNELGDGTQDGLAASWEYRVSRYSDYVESLTGYNFPSNVFTPTVTVNSISGSFTLGDTLYFSCRSYGAGGAISDWSDTLAVVVGTTPAAWGLLGDITAAEIGTLAVADSSGNGLNGTVVSNSSIVSNGSGGGALQPGTTGILHFPSNLSAGTGTAGVYESATRMTWAVKFKLTTLSLGEQILMVKLPVGHVTEYAYEMYIDSFNRVTLDLYHGGGTLRLISNTVHTSGVWYKFVATLDLSGTPSFFMVIDSAEVTYIESGGSVAALTTIRTGNNYALQIGAWSGDIAATYFHGLIDYTGIAVNSNILTLQQAKDL